MPYKDGAKQSRFQSDWQRRRRAEWLAQNGPCRDCESWEDLEVDHRERAEKVTHRVWSWTAERRAVELAKCEPRCRRCHRARTRAQLSKPLTHGTRVAYEKGCRCPECGEAKRTHNRLTRERRAARQGRPCSVPHDLTRGIPQ